MGVSSYLEIYLTQFGWLLYDHTWEVLSQTGIVFLPFIGMLLRNIVEPIKSQEAKDASTTSLRRIEIDLVIMFTVVVLAVQPILTIQHTNLNFTKACSNNQAVSGGNTGTTYDTTFTQAQLGGNNSLIPVWWYGVLAVSGGITNAVITGIPCQADLRLISYSINNSKIEDPLLRQQVREFFKDCYTPSMAAFLRHKQNLPNGIASDDIDWLGSQYFLNNLYPKIRARDEIPGFTYDVNRDIEYDPKVYIPVDGKPTCAQWWTGAGHINNVGLRQALLGQFEPQALNTFTNHVANIPNENQQSAENIAIRTLINQEESYFNGLKGLSMYNNASLANTANAMAGTAGALLEAIQFYPAMYMMKVAAPIIQAVVLMMIYMLMPFYFVFSSYRAGPLVFMSILVFSVKFWTVLWAVAHWLDNNLIEAINPAWYHIDLTQNNLVVTMVINFITAGLFIVMPMFWSGLLGWAGFRIGNEMIQVSNRMRDNSGMAGRAGGAAASSAALKSLKK